MNCPKCGNAVEKKPGPGRPAVFCGRTCRDLASYEVRRLVRRLEALETRLSWLGHKPEDDHLNANQRKYAAKRRAGEIEATGAEIAEAEARLRELLNETRGTRLSLPHERSDE